MMKSEACERNKGPILEVLRDVILPSDRRVLEIGAGTLQHATFFAPEFPFLEWFPTDIGANLLPQKTLWAQARIPNLMAPQRLDVGKDDFPKVKFDVVFTANTLHIMGWKECKSFFKLLGHRLREGSRAVFYGPFNYDGKFTSESNEAFHQMLKERNSESGIRAFEDVNNNMMKNGFELIEDREMPANNRMLVYSRLKFQG